MKLLTLVFVLFTILACDDPAETREKLAKGVEVAKRTAETVTEKAREAKEKVPEMAEKVEKVKEAARTVKDKAKKAEDKAADFVLPVDKAEKLGDRMAKEIFSKHQKVEGPVAAYVRELAAGLVEAAGNQPEGISYDFWVIRDEAVNAFAIPGGHIFVTTGLLNAAENEAELVAVLGHEIAHVIERHVAEGMVARYGVSAITAIALGRNADDLEKIVAEIVGRGLLLKHSRDDEREADELGLRITVDAGHSPMGYKTFFEKLAASNQVPALVSTHPNPGERAEDAAAVISDLEKKIRDRSLNEARFRQMTAGL